MLKRRALGGLTGAQIEPDKPTLHENDGAMAVLSSRRRGQADDEFRLYAFTCSMLTLSLLKKLHNQAWDHLEVPDVQGRNRLIELQRGHP
jgi:hypothetical protein